MGQRSAISSLALALAALSALWLVPGAAWGKVEEQEISRLFVHTAGGGTLERAKKPGRFVLKLHEVARQVVWFSDRPARLSGHIPIRGFVREWGGFGFRKIPPNAALSVLDAKEHQDTVIAKLRRPRYRAKAHRVRYRVRILDEATGNLTHFESHRDRRVPRHFRDASLFIDDATAPVINGCVIQPYTWCGGANIAGASLPGVNLTGAYFGPDKGPYFGKGSDLRFVDLSGAKLEGTTLLSANLEGSNLEGVRMDNAKAHGAGFHKANLRRADLGADFGSAGFRDADLTEANLSGAYLLDADFCNADLTGADPSFSNFTEALFCHTTMPDGTILDRDCMKLSC